jgi:ParB-like chromosome segregation protein Spo0J
MSDTSAHEMGQRSNPKPKRDKGRKVVEKRANKLEALEITYVSRLELKPNSYNPNRQSDHDFELLIRSMEEDGFTQPVIALRDTNEIVDGEHRWRAAGHVYGEDAQIPVVFVDMTPEQARIATLRHNRARGEEDIELSAAVLRDLRELGALDWAADSLMLDDVEIAKMLDDIPVPEQLAGDDYGEAWAPGEVSALPTVVQNGTGDQRRIEGMSTAAENRVRQMEQSIKNARGEEERQAIRRDAEIYRVTLLFTGDEGKLVKQVLGDTPAQTVLRLCQKESGVEESVTAESEE